MFGTSGIVLMKWSAIILLLLATMVFTVLFVVTRIEIGQANEASLHLGKSAMKQGARSFSHRFVKRGRMGWQITTAEIFDVIDKDWSLEGK